MTMKDTVASPLDALPVTMLAGTSITDGVALGGLRLFGIVMPSAWTQADITFQASFDQGASWHDLKDPSGDVIAVTASANDCVVWLPSAFAAVPMLKVQSGSSVAPVAQSADRALQLILRSL